MTDVEQREDEKCGDQNQITDIRPDLQKPIENQPVQDYFFAFGMDGKVLMQCVCNQPDSRKDVENRKKQEKNRAAGLYAVCQILVVEAQKRQNDEPTKQRVGGIGING